MTHEDLPTAEALARNGSIDDLYRWMSECVETFGRVDRAMQTCEPWFAESLIEDRDEAQAIWTACRRELDRHNHSVAA